MAKLITVFWRDIPSQVMARKGRDTKKNPVERKVSGSN